MRFFDCNTFIGKPTVALTSPPADPVTLLEAMDRAGIEKALVWHVAQSDYDALEGNALLAEAIAPHDRLVGCWALLPNQAGELGNLDDWLKRGFDARIRALRAWGSGAQPHRYLLRREALGDLLDVMAERRLPLILSAGNETKWPDIYDLMATTPDLRLVLCDIPCWGSDRYFRPLVERYRHVYVEISGYFVDGGIEAFVESYGPDRMLFGTDLPWFDPHHAIGAVLSADITDEDRHKILYRNPASLLTGVGVDVSTE